MGQRGAGAAAAEGRGGEQERHRGARKSDAGGEPETPAAPERDTKLKGEMGGWPGRWFFAGFSTGV